MRSSQKVALTLLAAFVITGVFAALAYTGLFRVLETDFFSRRVKTDQVLRLERIARSVTEWNDDNLSRFDSLVRDRNFQAVYSVNQREEEIRFRARAVDALSDRLMGFLGLRVVDADGRIQYSSFGGDIAAEQTGERRLYRNWNQVEGSFPLPGLGDEPDTKIIYDGERRRIIYLLPSLDRTFVVRGWMVVWLSPLGLADTLASNGMIAPGGGVRVVSNRGVIFDIRPEQAESVNEAIERLWPLDESPEDFALLAEAGGEKFWLAGTVAADGTWVGKPVPGRLLEFSTAVQILILSTVFITLTLVVFLILNLRHDRTEVLRRRVNRLQVNLLRDWLEHHDGRKLRLSDLESRRNEVKTELRSGLGTFKGDKSDKVDGIIDEGWTRIITILAEKEVERKGESAPGVPAEAPLPIDLKQLEEMITRAMAEAKIVAAPDALKNAAAQPAAAVLPSTPGRPISVEVVGDIEEAESAEELDEPLETEEVEELEEAESIEELDEPLETEEVEELEVSHSDEPADVEERADQLEELEQIDEIQPLDDVQDEEDVLEVLPVVLSDDDGELIEIDKSHGDKLYMFDRNSEQSEREQTGIEVPDDEPEEIEELDELEALPAEEVDSADGQAVSEDTVQFIDIAGILSRGVVSEGNIAAKKAGRREDETVTESLVMTRTTGILPGMDSSDEFQFEEESAVLSWSEDGLDYDRYLRGFKKNATGIYKSLMSLSKQYNALCGVIMVGSRKGLETDYAVGLDNDSATSLSVTRNEAVWSEWFSERKIVFVPNLSTSMYAEKTRHNEYRYIHSALFIPALYQGSQSYIFFGFKEAPKDLIPLLSGTEIVNNSLFH